MFRRRPIQFICGNEQKHILHQFQTVAYQKRHKKNHCSKLRYIGKSHHIRLAIEPRKFASPSRNSISIHTGLHAKIVLYPFIDHVALSATMTTNGRWAENEENTIVNFCGR
jgi:hypothetical protein